jgi:DNA-binding NtrC family response regulator
VRAIQVDAGSEFAAEQGFTPREFQDFHDCHRRIDAISSEGTGMAERRPQILIVDDEPGSRESLCELLTEEGYAVTTAEDGLEALLRLADSSFALIITELKMPRMDGMALLREMELRRLPSAVVVLTGRGSIETAVEAMRRDAYDYLTKPVDPQRLLQLIPKVLEAQRIRSALQTIRIPASDSEPRIQRMVGGSPRMLEVFDLIERVAPARASVLVTGESGTGKELVARAIHELSPRSAHAFVSVNSAALPPDLLENELFGHERGAFTGAVIRKEGCFELAHQGTLFLDEVADMSLATQAKLLRVLEGHPYRRLGGTREITVDVRVIAATNRSIDRALEEGRLRQDLYFRLSTVEIPLPPLRARGADFALLVRAFLSESSRTNGKSVTRIGPAAMDRLLRHPWPGNVRQLRNAIEHAVLLATGDTISLEDLPLGVREPGRAAGGPEGLYLHTIDQMERRLIAAALARFPTRTQAAEALGVSPRTLYNKIRRYALLSRDARADGTQPIGSEEEVMREARRLDSLFRLA